MIAVNLTMSEDFICSGCLVHDEKMKIDWEKREEIFKKILFKYKSKNNYDCIIPVSGGKDSLFQANYIKNLGLKPFFRITSQEFVRKLIILIE